MELILALLLLLQLEVAVAVFVWLRGRKTRLGKRPSFVDTSVLMDGRIIAAVQAGFVPGQLIIPQSVLKELQLLADGADSDKRARARHGLDIAALLKQLPATSVTILKDATSTLGVDDHLLELAKKYDGSICTIDFNLNKVATANDIPVLNINELAQQLRMNHLPGEKVSLKIMQKGNDAHQGVGYLSDGTMVVVERAQSDIGNTIEIEFIRSLQTVAGRMLFAKKIGQTTQKSRGGKAASKAKPTEAPRRKKRTQEDSLVELANQ